MPERICQRAGCGRPIPSPKRRDARWCSRSCESRASRAAKRKAAFETANPDAAQLLHMEDQSLVSLHGKARAPQHWRDLEAGQVEDDLMEFSDEYDVTMYERDRQDEDPGASFSDAYKVQEAVEQIRARYEEAARPLLAQQARNPGVRLPALVKLEQEREREINAIVRRHQLAQALERAARLAPQRVASAHERQVEQAAARSFAMDLRRGRFLRAEPEPAGRDVHQTWIW